MCCLFAAVTRLPVRDPPSTVLAVRAVRAVSVFGLFALTN